MAIQFSTLMLLLTFTSFPLTADCQLDISLSTSCGQITNHNITCCLCENGRLDTYTTLASSNSSLPFPGALPNDVSKWGQICSFIYDLQPCVKQKAGFPQCSTDILDDIFHNPVSGILLSSSCDCYNTDFIVSWSSIMHFYSRTCNKEQLNAKIQSVIKDPTLDKSLACVDDLTVRSTSRCFLALGSNLQDQVSANIGNPQSLLDITNRFYTDLLNCLFRVINRGTCNNATRHLAYHIARLSVPPNIKTNANEASTEDVTSSIRCTLGVYGDPHLKTCWRSELVACSAPGEQTYLRNKFIVIKGTNVEIGISIRATSLRAVSMTFYSFDGGNIIANYTATGGDLPTSFDEANFTTVGDGKNNVEITVGQFGRIRFSQKGSGAVLILRQWNGNYFFTLRMADNVLIGSSGLLVYGCPAYQVITRNQFRVRLKRNADITDCELSCDAVAKDEFKEACVIDCLATGDENFATNMTQAAKADYSVIKDYDASVIAEAKKHSGIITETKKPGGNGKGDKNDAGRHIVSLSTIVLSGLINLLFSLLM